MPIIPTGRPAWVRSVSHIDYGGDTNKTNWHSQGVTNARTDVGAEAYCRLAEDLAACSRTAPWATLTIQCDDVTPGPPSILAINQMTGVRPVSYVGNAPPSGFPSATRNGNSDISITWATSYVDDYGVSANIHIIGATIGIRGTSALMSSYELDDLNADGLVESVRVRLFVPAGTAATSAAFSISIATGVS